jgi:hypothetical protein
MILVVVSVAAGGAVVALVVGLIGLLMVRWATPAPSGRLALRRRVALAQNTAPTHRDRRRAA